MGRNPLKESYEDANEMLIDRLATLLSDMTQQRKFWERTAEDAVIALSHLAEEMQVCCELECSGILGMPGVARMIERRAYDEKWDGTVNNAAVKAARYYRMNMLKPAVEHKLRITGLANAGVTADLRGDPRGAVLRLLHPSLDSLGYAMNDGAPVWPPSRRSDYNYDTNFRRIVYWTLDRLGVAYTKSKTWDRSFIAACQLVIDNVGEDL